MGFSAEDLLLYPTDLSSDAIEALAEFAGIGLYNLHIPSGEIKLNHNITRLTGYEPGELPHTGDTKEMLTFEEDRPRVAACMESLLSGKTDRYKIEYRMRRRDGSIVSVSESAIVYERDDSGRPVRVAALSQDLSRLRWAEERTRDLEHKISRASENVPESDLARENHMLRAVNSAATMIIGGYHQDYETVLCLALQILAESIGASRAFIWRNTAPEEESGCFLRSTWSTDGLNLGAALSSEAAIIYDELLPDWRERFTEGADICARGGEIAPWMTKLPGAENARNIMISALYLHGEFWGLLGFDKDAEAPAFTHNESEIMVAGAMVIAASISRNETFIKLNEARETAIAGTRAKSEFLARMSHEIRTPMNAIIGMTSIAKKTEDPARIKYCLEKIESSSRQLLNLINDVLDMSKIDSGKLKIVNSPFNFEEMVQNVLNVAQVKLDEKRLNLRVDFSEVFTRMVISDELRLTQVLINLLNNAVKFTPEFGNIWIKIGVEQSGAGRARIRVEILDTGIGISKENQAKLFHSFEQADGSITRNYGGTGLGLAICKRIINLMGGDINVESEEGRGSSFFFEFEIEWGETLIKNDDVRQIPIDMRVLVVDDSQDVLEYFANILEGFGVKCDVAPGGEDALRAVQAGLENNQPYNIVFIDWNMPGMNGGQTASKIRSILGEDAVYVMISVADWADIEYDAKSYGVSNFLAKPVLPSALYNTIVDLSDNTLVKPPANEDCNKFDWSRHTLLVAEDVEINREIIQAVLEETGIKLAFAYDGQQAVEKFAASPELYSLILMDVQMPNMDGLTATRAIRAQGGEKAAAIPILAMTANAFKEDAEACRKAGMNAHITKPLNVDLLFEELEKYLL